MWVTRKLFQIPKKATLLLIRTYQRTFSPDHGWFKARHPNGYCKFYPSCSEYGHQVVKKYGVLKGVPRLVWRILRCNPWSKGGIDKV